MGYSVSPAFADGQATPYASEMIEHDSNIFDLPKSLGSPVGKNGPTFADTFFDTRAGAEGYYQLGLQRFFGQAEFRRFDYDNFTYLDHNENTIDAGLDYHLAQPINGTLEYKHDQRMVQFNQLQTATALIVEKENTGTASLNFLVTPEWRWENLATDHVLDSPRSNIPGLSLHEDSLKEGVKYLGVANLSAGLEATYLKGDYRNDPLALDPRYHQTSVALAGNYVVSGLTTFSGNLGYTKRTDPVNTGLSGFTGALSYQHALSGKTSINLFASRAINSYLTTGGNEVDTTFGGTLLYQFTYKMGLRLLYTRTNSNFPNQPDVVVPGQLAIGNFDRLDHYQTATLDLTYQVLHWLQIRPYARYQSRHSNEDLFEFSDNAVGIEFMVKPPHPPVRAAVR